VFFGSQSLMAKKLFGSQSLMTKESLSIIRNSVTLTKNPEYYLDHNHFLLKIEYV